MIFIIYIYIYNKNDNIKMVIKIGGKQISNNTITQEKLNLVQPTYDYDAATKEYVDNIKSVEMLSTANINMFALDTLDETGYVLACSTPILQEPLTNSEVKVLINNVNVTVGFGEFCYFSGDGGVTPKTDSNVEIGDYLYWVSANSNYELEIDDLVSFEYIISTSMSSTYYAMSPNERYQTLTNALNQSIDIVINHNAVCGVELLGNLTINLTNIVVGNGVISITEQSVDRTIIISSGLIDIKVIDGNEILTSTTDKLCIGWEYNGLWININYAYYK